MTLRSKQRSGVVSPRLLLLFILLGDANMELQAILIDVEKETVEPLTIYVKEKNEELDYADLSRQLKHYAKADVLDTGRTGTGDMFVVDDLGMANATISTKAVMSPIIYPAPLCGNVVLLGLTYKGDTVDAKTDINKIREAIKFDTVENFFRAKEVTGDWF